MCTFYLHQRGVNSIETKQFEDEGYSLEYRLRLLGKGILGILGLYKISKPKTNLTPTFTVNFSHRASYRAHIPKTPILNRENGGQIQN